MKSGITYHAEASKYMFGAIFGLPAPPVSIPSDPKNTNQQIVP